MSAGNSSVAMFCLNPDYFQSLNDWHLELAVFQEALELAVIEHSNFEGDRGDFVSLFNVLNAYLKTHVSSCPFPSIESQFPLKSETGALETE